MFARTRKREMHMRTCFAVHEGRGGGRMSELRTGVLASRTLVDITSQAITSARSHVARVGVCVAAEEYTRVRVTPDPAARQVRRDFSDDLLPV